jgi:hypothetical protein
MHVITLYKWRKAWRLQGGVVPATQRVSEGWDPVDKFTMALETSLLNSTELSAYCRERDTLPEKVVCWQQAAQDANFQPLISMAEQKLLKERHTQDERENKLLHRTKSAKTKPLRIWSDADRLNKVPDIWEGLTSEAD